MRRSTKGKALYQNFITRLNATANQCKMHRCRSRRKCDNFILSSDKVLEVFLKSIYIGTQRHYPVGIECFLHILLLYSIFTHVSKTEVNCFFRNVTHNLFFSTLIKSVNLSIIIYTRLLPVICYIVSPMPRI